MYSQSDINDAVEGGAISQEQATSLRSFIASRNGSPTGDEEHLRFVLGFNDIFVSLACLFALIAVAWLGSLIPIEGRRVGMLPLAVRAPFSGLFIAAASWGLAEIFVRRRHTALPGILLAFGFAGGVATFLLMLLASGGMTPSGVTILAFIAFGTGAAAAFLYWKRFHVPISMAVAALFGIIAIVSLMATSMGSADTLMIILLLAGIGIFLWAMWWDSQDPLRYTAKSDVAFWLHWLAGGLMVTALATLFGVAQRVDSAGGAIAILLIYALITLIALAVNRKVYLLAGLQPFISAIQNLIGGGSSYRYSDYDYGPVGSSGYSPYGSPYSSYPMRRYGPVESVETQMITMLIIAVLFILLAIYWAQVRRAIVGILPAGLRSRLPATGAEPTTQAETFD